MFFIRYDLVALQPVVYLPFGVEIHNDTKVETFQ